MASATRSAAGATPACPGIRADDPSPIMQFINFRALSAPRAGKWASPPVLPSRGGFFPARFARCLLHDALA